MAETNHVWYQILDKKGKPIIGKRYDNDICYGAISYGGKLLQRTDGFVRTWIETKYSPYKEEEIKKWIAEINKFSFEVYYEGVTDKIDDKKSYSFLLPLAYPPNNTKRGLMCALMMVRSLWEKGLTSIPKYYFKAREEVPNISRVNALQLAHAHIALNGYGNTNHAIFNASLYTLMRTGDFKKLINDPRPCWNYDSNVNLENALSLYISPVGKPPTYQYGAGGAFPKATFKESYDFIKSQSK